MIRHPRSRRATAAGLLAAAMLLGGCGGTDDTLADHPDPTYGPAITEEQAIAIAAEVTPGTVVEVRREGDRGNDVFEVITEGPGELFTSTQVRANDGAVLQVEELLSDGRVPSDGGPVATP